MTHLSFFTCLYSFILFFSFVRLFIRSFVFTVFNIDDSIFYFIIVATVVGIIVNVNSYSAQKTITD